MALDIEGATQQGRRLSRFLTDLTKAFKTLPRPAVRMCLPLSDPIVFCEVTGSSTGWDPETLCSCWCHLATSSSNGYPKGDPLSVVAMVLVNLAMHDLVAKASPISRVLTCDWEGVSDDSDATCRSFQAMQLADMVEQLDQKKNHVLGQ